MKNESIKVKYHNDLNTVPMRTWSSEEMNFFFSIVSKLKEKSTREIRFDKKELTELANYSDRNADRFQTIMENLGDKIQKMSYIERTKNSFEIMNLFQRFSVNWNNDLTDMTAIVKVTEEFEYVINQLNVQFTSFELREFTRIKSTYAKTAYRLLKQWRTVGRKEFNMEDFKRLMDIPKSYRASNIDIRVIKPIEKELPNFFIDLKVKKVKANTRGNPVTGYVFTWKPEMTRPYDPNKYSKQSVRSKQNPVRIETMPDWRQDESDDHVDPEMEKYFQERLKEMRNDNS